MKILDEWWSIGYVLFNNIGLEGVLILSGQCYDSGLFRFDNIVISYHFVFLHLKYSTITVMVIS